MSAKNLTRNLRARRDTAAEIARRAPYYATRRMDIQCHRYWLLHAHNNPRITR